MCTPAFGRAPLPRLDGSGEALELEVFGVAVDIVAVSEGLFHTAFRERGG